MLFQIAWRNLFRNRLRSFVIMFAIALGICVGIFFLGFSWGLMDQRGRDIIDTQLGHIQLHAERFSLEDSADLQLENAVQLAGALAERKEIKAVSPRTLRTGMIASSRKSQGVLIQGVDPESERSVTTIADKIIEGSFLASKGRNPIVIGENLAEALGVKIRSKITLTFYQTDGEITSGAFRIVGLYKTASSPWDKMNAFVKRSDLQRLMLGENVIHEIALRLEEPEYVEEQKVALQSSFSGPKIESWADVQPTLRLMNEQFDMSVNIFMGIILFALMFGILNTMLMAVLERKKELGMLMAVGMSRQQIFGMIMIETMMLSLVGAALGMLAGWALVSWFGMRGIPLSVIAEGLSSMGMADVVYTKLEWIYYLQIVGMVVSVAIIAAIPPARKALKLNPVEAIR
jgi:ABC-type lipoprotein release transport system permease subunit